jgi:hypothetical protein
MASFFDVLSTQLGQAWRPRRRPTAHRAYRCVCERPVFFRNSECLACHTPLGYEARLAQVLPLRGASDDGVLWQAATDASPDVYRRCENFHSAAGCNWLVPEDDPAPLCVACRLNRTIPDLSREDNALLWQRIESAKRRLVSSLVALRLPVRSRVSEDPDQGLAFDFLRAEPDGPPVLTGHAQGIITLNVEEADDAYRERVRTAMREPYRTLLGHLRHEVGHYYWDRLVAGTGWLEGFRTLFGDERADYAAALQRHYDRGPAPDWAHHHVSAYASTHPWEDWAETWAHYLHMVDTLDTALSFGLEADDLEISYEAFGPDSLYRPDDPGATRFLSFVNAWTELTGVLNELSRSMGQHDFYPFVLPHEAVAKLQFVHIVVSDAGSAR